MILHKISNYFINFLIIVMMFGYMDFGIEIIEMNILFEILITINFIELEQILNFYFYKFY